LVLGRFCYTANEMKVAIVHDYLNQYGGAERVLEVLCELFPRAPIYTLIYDPEKTGFAFKDREIKTSFLQKIPLAKNHHRLFPLLMPIAIEQFDLGYFDLVISNSASFGKGVVTKPETKHICYCMTPTRFLWGGSHRFVREFDLPWPVRKFLPLAMSYLRSWDQNAAQRPDSFIAISEFIRRKIKKYYHRSARVVHPPVTLENFSLSDRVPEYFLMVGRLVPYKRFDLAIKAFNQLGYPLKIIGSGPQLRELRRMARPNIEFVGLVPDLKLSRYYQKARAVIFPQEEDFGIVPLEAMASGVSVIAYGAGGALETVLAEKTGVFFEEQTPEALIGAIRRWEKIKFQPKLIRGQAGNFERAIFKKKITAEITSILES